jgi:pilus assembly protein TadC
VLIANGLYLLALYILAEEVEFSLYGLWFTLSHGTLLMSFIAFAVGALLPGVLVHYLGMRLIRSAESSDALRRVVRF